MPKTERISDRHMALLRKQYADLRGNDLPSFREFAKTGLLLIAECDALRAERDAAREEAEGFRDFIDEVHGGEPLVCSWEEDNA